MTMTDATYIMLAGAGITIIVGGGIYLGKSMRQTAAPTGVNGQERELLAHASDRWTDKQIPLAELATIWLEKEEDRQTLPRPKFSQDDISVFWIDVIEPLKYLPLNRRAAIIALLNILDKSGDCPSVVRNPEYRSEVENDYGDDMFSYLSKISLREHTLLVARHIAKRSSRDILIPDGIIIALGHDLGKIPVYHDKGYSTGDHPIISSIVMSGLPELEALPNYQELCNMVKSHHHIKPHNAFAGLLKDCDQIARNEESARRFRTPVETQQRAMVTSVTATIPKSDLPQSKPTANQNDHPMGHQPQQKSRIELEIVDVPWFNAAALLEGIKNAINRVNNGRWAAASMPDGLVYVNPEYIWSVLKKTSGDEGKATLTAIEANASAKQNVLYTVVRKLDENHRAIAADAISPDYYFVTTTLTDSNNNTKQGIPMVPFRAEAFGTLPSELESTKSPTLRKMVKSIHIARFQKKED